MSQVPKNSCAAAGPEPDDIRQSVYSDFYLPAVLALNQAELPFLVGGAYSFERFTGIERTLKDFDIFVRPEDCERTLECFSKIGYQTQILFPPPAGQSNLRPALHRHYLQFWQRH